MRNLPEGSEDLKIDLIDVAGRTIAKKIKAKVDNGAVEVTLDLKDHPDLAAPLDLQPGQVKRQGKFRVLNNNAPLFHGFSLSAAFVTKEQEEKLSKILFDTQPAGDGWVLVGPPAPEALSALGLSGDELGFNGVFDIRLSPVEAAIGWVYVLSGSRTIVGYYTDKPEIPVRRGITIFIPDFGATVRIGPVSGGRIIVDPKYSVDGSGGSTPISVSEADITDDPELFSEDPGNFVSRSVVLNELSTKNAFKQFCESSSLKFWVRRD